MIYQNGLINNREIMKNQMIGKNNKQTCIFKISMNIIQIDKKNGIINYQLYRIRIIKTKIWIKKPNNGYK